MTIRRLVLVQHALFAVLTAVCVGRALSTASVSGPLLLSVALLVLWYAAGARSADTHVDLLVTSPLEDRPVRALGTGGWWLLGLVLCWLVTVVVSPEMVWVAFSLWLLAGHLLPLRVAVPVSLLVLAAVVMGPWHAGELTVAGVVGPVVGGTFAVALSRGVHAVVRDSVERQRLVSSLYAAQEEAEVLHAELAATQREAGVLSERTRLSRDIHDTLAQGFFSILLLARASGATEEPGEHRRLLGQIERSAGEHLDEARRVVAALAPATLESGLHEALRRIASRFEDETGVRTELRVEGDVHALPLVVEVALLRTAQAALANVRRHAGARRTVVTLAEADTSVRLDVVDDGRGFDLATVAETAPSAGSGYGLRASRERLRELGGDLQVESEPGAGTAVSASVPLGRPGTE